MPTGNAFVESTYSLALLYAAIFLPLGDIENPKASPVGKPADAVAVFETNLMMCIRGRLGSSSCIDCQLYLTRSLLNGICVVLIHEERVDDLRWRGVCMGPFAIELRLLLEPFVGGDEIVWVLKCEGGLRLALTVPCW